MTESYPSLEGTKLAQDADAVALFNDWKELVRAMRNIRAEYNIEPAIKTGPTIICADDALADVIRRETQALALLAKVDPERVTVVKVRPMQIEDDAVQLAWPGWEVTLYPSKMAKDVKKELDRLSTQLKSSQGHRRFEGRLGNGASRTKPPHGVVAPRQRPSSAEQKATLDASIAELGNDKFTLHDGLAMIAVSLFRDGDLVLSSLV